MNEQEFWASARRDDEGECLIWFRTKTSAGYGNVRFGGKTHTAHRLAYELTNGPVPKGMELDHLCRNRLCIDPTHLEPVTRRENILRGEGPTARHARQTHCSRGHEFTPENTYRRPGHNIRTCRTCQRERQATK